MRENISKKNSFAAAFFAILNIALLAMVISYRLFLYAMPYILRTNNATIYLWSLIAFAISGGLAWGFFPRKLITKKQIITRSSAVIIGKVLIFPLLTILLFYGGLRIEIMRRKDAIFLKHIYLPLVSYADDNNGIFPNSLADIFPYYSSLRDGFSMHSGKEVTLNSITDGAIDYIYYGGHKIYYDGHKVLHSDTILMHTRPGFMAGFVAVLYTDGNGGLIKSSKLKEKLESK